MPPEVLDLMRAKSAAWIAMIHLLNAQYLLKGEAFSEEQEWRLHCGLGAIKLSTCKFRARGPAVVPYLELELSKLQGQPISEVVLGPKNPTPVHVVRAMLVSFGFQGVAVTRSSATYC